jgi:hypothetical protein
MKLQSLTGRVKDPFLSNAGGCIYDGTRLFDSAV